MTCSASSLRGNNLFGTHTILLPPLDSGLMFLVAETGVGLRRGTIPFARKDECTGSKTKVLSV